MLSHKYKMPLKLDLTPSIFLLYFIVVIHLLALSVLTLKLNIHSGLLFLIAIVIFISLYRSLKQCRSVKFNQYIKNVEFNDALQCNLIHSNNHLSVVELQKNWYKLSWLLILYFKLNDRDEKNITLIILPDMLQIEQSRQLKLYLIQVSLSKKKSTF